MGPLLVRVCTSNCVNRNRELVPLRIDVVAGPKLLAMLGGKIVQCSRKCEESDSHFDRLIELFTVFLILHHCLPPDGNPVGKVLLGQTEVATNIAQVAMIELDSSIQYDKAEYCL